MFKLSAQRRQFFAAVRTIRLFEECTDRELVRISPSMTEVDLPAGRVLTRQGAPGFDCFAILHGEATVERDGIVTAVAGEGEFLGELALLDHMPRTATVTTTTPARVLVMSARELSALREAHIASVTRRLDEIARAHRVAVQDRPVAAVA